MFASLDDQNGRSDFEVKVFPECNAQHDEVEPNLEKILHRNGIWGLEAIVMQFPLPI